MRSVLGWSGLRSECGHGGKGANRLPRTGYGGIGSMVKLVLGSGHHANGDGHAPNGAGHDEAPEQP